jgi:lipopolysaccharide/colanic/teichoic acid biosynthesis glycosyltransferase
MYSPRELVLKRAFDVGAAVAGLLVATPVLVATAVLVKLSSSGPVFFAQQRVGRNGRHFRIFKFRSMRVDQPGALVTASSDPRVTSVGRVLRRTKLDELPQLFNVLRGDLSLVGPRPEVPRYVALYSESDRLFLQSVRPGITDPATIRFRNEEQILASSADPERTYVEEVLPSKVRLYREYLERASFLSDIRVLSETLQVVVCPALAAATSGAGPASGARATGSPRFSS